MGTNMVVSGSGQRAGGEEGELHRKERQKERKKEKVCSVHLFFIVLQTVIEGGER
jgi:hypothetical protein